VLKKDGIQLHDILASSEEDCVRRLRDEFSITTAEELFCASLKRPDALRQHLNLTNEKWAMLMRAIEAVLPLEVRRKLELPLTRHFAKGSRLHPPPTGMLDDLKKYTSSD
jgi:hypothetical protein